MVENQHRKAGRPRDPRLNEALLQAGREVFMERGYQHATVSEIARRAGVGTPAIYRRWPRKAHMAFDIYVGEMKTDPIPDTGSIRDDLVHFLRDRLRAFSTPFFHRVLLPLLQDAYGDEQVAEIVRQGFEQYRVPNPEARLRKAIAAGQLHPDAVPGRLLDQLQGPIAIPLLFTQKLPDVSEAEAIVDTVLRGFAPNGA